MPTEAQRKKLDNTFRTKIKSHLKANKSVLTYEDVHKTLTHNNAVYLIVEDDGMATNVFPIIPDKYTSEEVTKILHQFQKNIKANMSSSILWDDKQKRRLASADSWDEKIHADEIDELNEKFETNTKEGTSATLERFKKIVTPPKKAKWDSWDDWETW
jgi:hypothetical protein